MSFHIFRRPSVSVALQRWADGAREQAAKYEQDAAKLQRRSEVIAAEAAHARKLAAMYNSLADGYVKEIESLDGFHG